MSLPLTTTAQSMMESDGYKMQSDSINFAGSLSSSTNYAVEDTLGEAVSGQSDSTDYSAYLGYQFMGFAVEDTESPTAPATLTAQVISRSEIELSWSASTDNVGVDRYYIYRDGVRIDDVAIFPRDFTDTGLTASTSYEYNVSAVDDALNESLWSATTTATTTAEAVEESSSSGGGSTRVVANLEEWFVTSNDTNALVNFSTNFSTASGIYWGRDLSYSDGSVSLQSSSYHSYLIDELLPSTQYYLKIVLLDEYGNSRTIENISFRTLNVAISLSPTNVSNFNAESFDDHIRLGWDMPNDSRVVGVTIVRSETMYPTSPTDGDTVFESDDASRIEMFEDRDVEAGKTYYYSIFAKDLAGNFSSGAVTMSRILLVGEDAPINPLDNLLPAGNVHPQIEALRIKDFLFIQSGDSVSIPGEVVNVSGDENLTVALRYYRVPPVLKTIAVTLLTDEEEPKRFTFILRPNRDKTRYEATIGSLGEARSYSLRIDILDFKNQGLKTLSGKLNVNDTPAQPQMFDERTKAILGWSALGLVVITGASYVVSARMRKVPALVGKSGLDGSIEKQ